MTITSAAPTHKTTAEYTGKYSDDTESPLNPPTHHKPSSSSSELSRKTLQFMLKRQSLNKTCTNSSACPISFCPSSSRVVLPGKDWNQRLRRASMIRETVRRESLDPARCRGSFNLVPTDCDKSKKPNLFATKSRL